MEHTEGAPQLSAEQQLELEKARRERLESERALLAQQEQQQADKQRRQRASLEASFRGAIAQSGMTIHPQPQELIELTRDYAIEQHDDGTVTGTVNGQKASLKEVLEDLVRKHPSIADGRTVPQHLRKEAVKEQPKYPRSRSEFSMAQKVEFLSDPENLPIWEAMPQLPPPAAKPVNELTKVEWRALSIAERTRIIAELGQSGVDPSIFIAKLR